MTKREIEKVSESNSAKKIYFNSRSTTQIQICRPSLSCVNRRNGADDGKRSETNPENASQRQNRTPKAKII